MTPEPVQQAESPTSSTGTTVRWLGHSTVLIEMDGVRLLTDPVLRARVGHLVRIAPPARPRDVGVLDCVLLSHLHADHADLSTLRALIRTGPIVAPSPARGWLTDRGLRTVIDVSVGQEIAVGPVSVRAVHAEHEGRRWPRGPSANPVGFVIQGSRTIYFAGDTDLFPAMTELRGLVDLALLPVWGWGRGVGRGHLDPQRAAEAAALIMPTVAVPIHWGTLALPSLLRSRSDPAQPAEEFVRQIAQRAPDVEARIISPGAGTAL